MKFVLLNNGSLLVNLDAIESITNKPGAASTLTFRDGRTLDIADGLAGQVVALLQKNGLMLS